jgi:DeoR family fructose operon transcriptional repressor
LLNGTFFNMNQVERHRNILEVLSRQDFVDLEDLCKRLNASRATVRRDLIDLEHSRNIRRVRGGAMSTNTREEALDFRQLSVSCHEEKMRIGKAAAELIEDGQTIILGGGSTVVEVARCLCDRPIQVITNSIPGCPGVLGVPANRGYIDRRISLSSPRHSVWPDLRTHAARRFC